MLGNAVLQNMRIRLATKIFLHFLAGKTIINHSPRLMRLYPNGRNWSKSDDRIVSVEDVSLLQTLDSGKVSPFKVLLDERQVLFIQNWKAWNRCKIFDLIILGLRYGTIGASPKFYIPRFQIYFLRFRHSKRQEIKTIERQTISERAITWPRPSTPFLKSLDRTQFTSAI